MILVDNNEVKNSKQLKLNTMKREDVLLVLSYSNCDEYELKQSMKEVEELIIQETVRASVYDTELVEKLQTERWVIETILNTITNKN